MVHLTPDFDAGAVIAALPDGNYLMKGKTYNEAARIVDANLQTVKILPEIRSSMQSAVAGDLGLFVGSTLSTLKRLELQSFSVVAEYSSEEYLGFDSLTLAPDGRLFAIGYHGGAQDDEVVCFDARSLDLQQRFGKGRFEFGASGMCVCSNALYVGNTAANCIDAFSLAGQHLRSISGDCGRPHYLRCVHDRLYMTEHEADNAEDYDDLVEGSPEWIERDKWGKRILVLTPEGETLQSYEMRDDLDGLRFITRIIVSGTSKEVLCNAFNGANVGEHNYRVVALKCV